MKFSSQEDVNAPATDVFDMLCDFDRFERAAMRRGAEILRHNGPGDGPDGTSWDARFHLRGRIRKLSVEVSRCEPPDWLGLHLKSSGLTGEIAFELISLSTTRTRLLITLELQPVSLSARLLIQSLRLSKSALTQKYKDRVADFVRDLEKKHDQQA